MKVDEIKMGTRVWYDSDRWAMPLAGVIVAPPGEGPCQVMVSGGTVESCDHDRLCARTGTELGADRAYWRALGELTPHVKDDPIDHPAHYTHGNIEPIDVIEDWDLPFHIACVVKYVARADHKGERLKDLKKARWYLDREITRVERLAALGEDFNRNEEESGPELSSAVCTGGHNEEDFKTKNFARTQCGRMVAYSRYTAKSVRRMPKEVVDSCIRSGDLTVVEEDK